MTIKRSRSGNEQNNRGTPDTSWKELAFVYRLGSGSHDPQTRNYRGSRRLWKGPTSGRLEAAKPKHRPVLCLIDTVRLPEFVGNAGATMPEG